MGQRKSVACGFGLKFQYTEKDYLGRIPVTEVLVELLYFLKEGE